MIRLLAVLVAAILGGAAAQGDSIRPDGSATAQLSLRQPGVGRATPVELRFKPGTSLGELYVSLWNQSGRPAIRWGRSIRPVAPGLYRFEYPFARPGSWTFYARYGLGQAGSTAWTTLDIGSSPSLSSLSTALAFEREGFRAGVPGSVQPLGYAAFALVALAALAGVAALLARVARRPRPPVAA